MVIALSIFLISAATLALELVLVRALSIGHWHNFSYLIISTALLGFGGGGTFITIFAKTLTEKYKTALWSFCTASAVLVPAVFYITQKVPLDELQLIWDRRQILYLLAYYLLFFLPFFCAGSFIALAFTKFGRSAHRLYFYNMTGSGLGAAGAVALMYGNSPEYLLLIISAALFLTAMLLAIQCSKKYIVFTIIIAGVLFWFFNPFSRDENKLEIRLSENKSLNYYRALPNAKILESRYSPIARLDCISAPTIRYFPGMSFSFKGALPEQMLIISDADAISAVNHFENIQDLKCYDYTTSALAYHLTEKPSVCIIGTGGGSDVCQGLIEDAKKITAVEMNKQTIDWMRGKLSDFAANIYQRENVDLVNAEGRTFLETTAESFDIINISLLDSFSASAAGLYSLNESHLYTIEAIRQAMAKLKPNGLLTITRVLKTPARDAVKMFATITEALREKGIKKPEENIIMIRSWATATIVAKPKAFSKNQIENTREFTKKKCFDLVHLPGLKMKETNRFHKLENPVYYNAAREILSERYLEFLHEYPYNIRPATDNKPYFFDFFKFKSLPLLMKKMPRNWLLFSEWGYLVLAATLLQAIIASAILIILPLFIAGDVRGVASGKTLTLTYFLLLGLAYMFLEMAFIQKMTLLIGHPVFGVAVTLVSFLFFSGCGSLVSGKVRRPGFTKICIAVAGVVITGLALIILLTFAFDRLIGFTRPMRILSGLILTAPLAFFMGIPFPTGLKQTHINHKPLLPWAWGVNGFASVTAAVLGTSLAISIGFNALAVIALVCYCTAAVLAKPLCSQQVR